MMPGGQGARHRPLWSLFVNVVANALGRYWSGLLQFAFTPAYVRLLGPEAYGLVGFYAMLLGTLALLDGGVSPVLTREFGRLGGRDAAAGEMRDLLRSLEAVSLATAAVAGALVIVAAPQIVEHWLRPGRLPPAEVVGAVRLMGLVIACQWPSNLYSAGFVGLHRQDRLLRLRLGFVTAQWAGAALLLWRVAPRVELLLGWQALCFAVLSLWLGRALWRLLPPWPVRPKFRAASLRAVWRFAAGSFAIGVSIAVLTQADKLVVSRYAALGVFAGYSLAFTLGSLISILVVQPIGSALLPHFARVFAEGDRGVLAHDYHRWTQVVAALTLPLAGMLIAFAHPLVAAWLGPGSSLVGPVAALLPWVAAGTTFNSLMMLPYVLQIASGWTRLSVTQNLVTAALLIPALVLGVRTFGAAAGAWYWLAMNVGYYLIMVPLMHRRLLRREMLRWWRDDTLLPMAVAGAIFALSWALAPENPSRLEGLAQAAGTAVVAGAVLGLMMPHPRAMALVLILRFRQWQAG